MAATPAPIALRHHTSESATHLLDDLSITYADAYGTVPGEDIIVKTSAFRARASRAIGAPHYSLVTAQVDSQLVGFAFGYNLRPDSTWWEGLTPAPPADFTSETGGRTVVLAEIEVSKAWQSRGIGHSAARCVPRWSD
jgi:hypothetical protein